METMSEAKISTAMSGADPAGRACRSVSRPYLRWLVAEGTAPAANGEPEIPVDVVRRRAQLERGTVTFPSGGSDNFAISLPYGQLPRSRL